MTSRERRYFEERYGYKAAERGRGWGQEPSPMTFPQQPPPRAFRFPRGRAAGDCPRAPGKASDTKWGALGYTSPRAGPWAGPEGEGRHF